MAQALNTVSDTDLAIAGTINPQYFSRKHILVLGASGLIGTGLTLSLTRLAGPDGSITATGRNVENLRRRFGADITGTTDDIEHAPVICVALDVTKPLPNIGGFDIIINAASAADPASFANKPVETALANVIGVNHILNYAVEHHTAQVLQFSSGEVYGYGNTPHLVREDDLEYLPMLSARSSYPMSKRMAETLCTSYQAEYGVDVRIARPSHIFGPLFTASDSRVSADFFRMALRGEDISLTSPGTQKRTYTYIADCISGVLSIISSGTAGTAYNVANSSNRVTLGEFAEAIAQKMGVSVHYGHATDNYGTQITKSPSPGRPQQYRLSELDNTRLRTIGWNPRVNLADGVSRTIDELTAGNIK